MARTRWAICDSSKFARLVQNLKDLIDGLSQITTSPRTSLLKGHLIRHEAEAIPDLHILKIIEDTCSDADWRMAASAAGSSLSSIGHITSAKRTYIQEWMGVDQSHRTSPQVQEATDLPWLARQYQGRNRTLNTNVDASQIQNMTPNHPRLEITNYHTPMLERISKPSP